jgi:oxygen-dependent protoporphyrinogen oxidase
VYEASDRVGGVVRSLSRGGYLMEAGPDSFLDKLGIAALCAELGLEAQLIRVRPEARRSFIVRGRRLLPIPEGLYLMAPSAIGPFLRSPVVSWPGKARMLLDLAIPRRRSRGDEPLAAFVRRRLGQEALDRLAQPLLGGIYGADPGQLSLAATMPQFLEMERRRGSVIRALLAGPQQASGARYGLFLSLRDGLQTLTDALASQAGTIHLNTRVTTIGDLQADAIVLALPLPQAALMLGGVTLPPTHYSSSATINFGFRRAQVRHPLNGAGFVVPHVEGRTIIACTFSSRKFDGRAPDDRVLLRAFAGGMLGREAYALPDGQLVEAALRDLAELLGISGEPDEVWLKRLPDSMPQYEPGHLEHVDGIRTPAHVALAGNAYRGVGLPDCIATAFAAAEKVLDGRFQP